MTSNRLIGVSLLLTFALQASATRAGDIDDAVAGMNDAAGQLLALKEYGDAEHAYRSALKYRPQDRTALKGLADTLTAEGKTQEAATYYAQLNGAQPAIAPTPAAVPPALPAANVPPPVPTAAETPAPVAAPAAPVQLMPAPANVGTPLAGWTGYIKVGPQGSVFGNFIYFTKAGYIYTGPPTGRISMAEVQRRDPDRFGTYTYDGSELHITYASGKTETRRFKNGTCDGGILEESGEIKEGSTFEATYSRSTNAMSFGGVTAMSGGTWHFHADGTFDNASYAGAETTGGNHEADALGAGKAQTRGRYAIKDGMLILNGVESHRLGYIGRDHPPATICIDDASYRLQS